MGAFLEDSWWIYHSHPFPSSAVCLPISPKKPPQNFSESKSPVKQITFRSTSAVSFPPFSEAAMAPPWNSANRPVFGPEGPDARSPGSAWSMNDIYGDVITYVYIYMYTKNTYIYIYYIYIYSLLIIIIYNIVCVYSYAMSFIRHIIYIYIHIYIYIYICIYIYIIRCMYI